MKGHSKSLWRVISIRCLAVVLVITGISCHGLSLGRSPLFGRVPRADGLHRGRNYAWFGASWGGPNLGSKLGKRVAPRRFRNGKIGHNEGSNLYSRYLDDMDKQSGKNYDMRYGKTDADLVECPVTRVQNAFESLPVPFSNIISQEYWDDIRLRSKYYVSDWTDGFKKKQQVIPAILFLYFACLSPAVSFGTIASQITDGSIGIVEFLLSSGLSGMAYAVLCGQPMAFIAPTGLTLAFISGLFRFCSVKGLPFFPVYSWVGIWTSFFMIILGVRGSSKLIKYCTRFTDEVFNALLSVNFIYEALRSIQRLFQNAKDPMNLTMPFVSLGMALTTFWATRKVVLFQKTKFFSEKARAIIKNFGPPTIFVLMSLLNQLPWIKKFGVPTLNIPPGFQLSGGRELLVPLNAVPLKVKLFCSLPALLLTCLFFMDQNISVRVVNNPDNKLKKGPAYNLDMVALGGITAGLSIMGLPWMCGATVQSVNHLKALTETKFNPETGEVEIVDVTETRLTGLVIHAMIASTFLLLGLLKYIPIPVVSGVFLFLGRKLMTGNSFFQRLRDSFAERKRLPDDHPINVIGRNKTNLFTGIQIACLYGLWAFKQNAQTAIFFPSVIGLLMVIRAFGLPKIFTETELTELGDATPW